MEPSYRSLPSSYLQASSNAAVLSEPRTYWVTYDNALTIVPGAGPGLVNDSDPRVQLVTNLPEPGETHIVAANLRNGSPMLLGASQLTTTIESAWLFYGAAAKIASGVDPASPDPHVASCSESASEGWDVITNGMSTAMYHEHMQQFIGASGVKRGEAIAWK